METIYVDPENYGIDSGKLREMLEVLEKEAELHSISVKYEGKTILEGAWKPFTLEDPQMMHSLSKTGTAICVGFALDEGKLKLEAPFLDYIREDLPEEYDPALEKITVYDLLTMQAGSPFCCNNVWFSRLEKNWETAWLREKKILEDIGKVFHYDSGCSYTLSRIVTKVMGKNCRTLLDERVFEKMGFREIRWLSSPEGHSTGGWGLYLTAREISELGVLFLRKGKWKGEQLIPAWWVETLSKPQVAIPGCAGKSAVPLCLSYQSRERDVCGGRRFWTVFALFSEFSCYNRHYSGNNGREDTGYLSCLYKGSFSAEVCCAGASGRAQQKSEEKNGRFKSCLSKGRTCPVGGG